MTHKEQRRKINLRAGWRDGHNGESKNIPTRLVARMSKGGNFIPCKAPVPQDEEDAYHRGFEEGRNAPADAKSPYIT